MNIHEHQAKKLLQEFGAPVSKGVVIFSLGEIKDKIKQLTSKEFMLKAICIEASEQCGRVTIPIIEPPETLGNILAEWPRQKGLLFLDESGSGKPILEVLKEKTSWQANSILVGPEGGFTSAERDKILENPFIRAATLGERLVRAETAAISALSIYNANVVINNYKN